MFKAAVIRGGKWAGNLYSDNSVYGDFQFLDDAIKWINEEYKEFRGGWSVAKIIIEEVLR